jgi:hypothetical protein
MTAKRRSLKTLYNGILYDSKMEAQYAEYLDGLMKTGEILEIKRQISCQIIPSFEKYGKKHRKAVYTPDFWVRYKDGSTAYIEVKGMSDTAADLRRKAFDSQYPDTLLWVTGVDSVNKRWTRWLPYDDVVKMRKAKRKKAKEAS